MLGKFSRRYFCEACGLLPRLEWRRRLRDRRRARLDQGTTRLSQPASPNGFVWGPATSAQQIEGAVHRRVPSSAYSSITNQIIALLEETTQLATTSLIPGGPYGAKAP